MKHQKTRRDFIKKMSLGIAGLPLVGFSSCRKKTQKKPNIILIMSDDMGFSDIGCYGGEISTPNLDRLASNGLRFTQFYNTARCCPTRASLLTGLYPHQAGIGHMMNDRDLEGYRGDLSRHSMTIAEVLKRVGYSTYMAGKWHVTPHIKPEGPKYNWPLQRGFDRFFGTIDGAGSFYDPNSLTHDNTMIPPGKEFYYTDAISDNAVNYINGHSTENPFFMYVSYTSAHWPMHALQKDIDKYKGKYDEGWDAIRDERYHRLIQMGFIDRKWLLSNRDSEVPAWENENMKEWQVRLMEVYAAMVDCMDQGIGRIIKTLKQKGEFENTLIFFLQDNGACAETLGIEEPYIKSFFDNIEPKPMDRNDLQYNMVPKFTRDGSPVRNGIGLMPGQADTYIAYGVGWANASNTPFRMYKHWVHEGGISTPLIVHWPEQLKNRGELRHQPGHLIDIMATCVDVASANYPGEYKGNRITPMEGKSLVPAFDNNPVEREAIFWEHEGNRAIRQGKWKLVAKVRRNRQFTEVDQDSWELYDLESDRTETNNLSNLFPDRVKQMGLMWEQWAYRAKVLPWPWSNRKKV